MNKAPKELFLLHKCGADMEFTIKQELKFKEKLLADIPLYVDLIVCLKEGLAEVISDSGEGLMLKMYSWENYMIAAETLDEGRRLLGMLPPKCGSGEEDVEIVLRGHGISDELNEMAMKEFGFVNSHRCHQVVYEKDVPPECGSSLDVRSPDMKDFDLVKASYSLVDVETLYEHFCGSDFVGGYLDGKMVGFAGLHTEGSLGMLFVFNEYRRRGFAEEIASALIKRQIMLQRIPYAQIFYDNTASVEMQKKLGFAFSKEQIFWMDRGRKN